MKAEQVIKRVGSWAGESDDIFIKGYGTTVQLGIRLFRNSAATSALGRPTSLDLQNTKC